MLYFLVIFTYKLKRRKMDKEEKYAPIKIMAECRPWSSLTCGSLRAMMTICKNRGSNYYDSGKIAKWVNNNELLILLERELASRN